MFGDTAVDGAWDGLDVDIETPAWLEGCRDALTAAGSYLAYHDNARVRVVPLDEGWTRIGRSLSAHLRLDDPTVSRRHALVHCEAGGARVLDDRSLNGVFRNRERVEWSELEDGDEITIGRFRLFFIALAEGSQRGPSRFRAIASGGPSRSAGVAP
jgi:pSer/pThr/pTyr-binding forkhead associated (FHA) protein